MCGHAADDMDDCWNGLGSFFNECDKETGSIKHEENGWQPVCLPPCFLNRHGGKRC